MYADSGLISGKGVFMGTRINQIIAATLFILLVLRPGISMPRDDRGAYLVVMLKDGQEVEGELLAVKQDSLLVLKRLPEEGVTIALVDIGKVKIVRKSKALLGGAAGLLAGAGIGALWGHSLSDGEYADFGAFLGGIIIGGIGTVVGLVVGAAAGLDTMIVLADRPEPEVKFALSRLSRMSRNPGASAFLVREMAPSGGVIRTPTVRPNAPAESSLYRSRASRFRLTWAPGIDTRPEPSGGRDNVSFRLVDEPLPTDMGPITGSFTFNQEQRRLCLGRMSVAYEWTPHWSTDLELFTSGRYSAWWSGSLYLPSTQDGEGYSPESYASIREESNATCLLAGLAFRPFPPAVFRPHVLEAAVGAGPAWIRTTRTTLSSSRTTTGKRETRLAWTARARIAYEYYFTSAFGIGAFVEYRWLTANIPTFTWTETLEFWSHEARSSRRVEMSFSGRKLALANSACGLRFTLRF